MVDWVLRAGADVGASPIVVVAAPQTSGDFEGYEVAVQEVPRGTGDAVRAARAALEGRAEHVLVPCSGDAVPFSTRRDAARPASPCTSRPAPPPPCSASRNTRTPGSYGRLVRGERRKLCERIVEARDATDEELAITEANSSIYVFRAEKLWPTLDRIEANNAQGEIYLTDAIGLLVGGGDEVAVSIAAESFEAGVNTRAELADAARVLRDRINLAHMLGGVTVEDPATTWIEADVEIEPDVTLHPFVSLRGRVPRRSRRGPRSNRTRWPSTPRSVPARSVGQILLPSPRNGSRVGLEGGYVRGDQGLTHRTTHKSAAPFIHRRRRYRGRHQQVGAGAITANLPHQPNGVPKGRTRIGKNVRTAIHNGFVAPVEVGDGAWIAAGSTITKDVPADALAIARARQENKEGYAARHRDD